MTVRVLLPRARLLPPLLTALAPTTAVPLTVTAAVPLPTVAVYADVPAENAGESVPLESDRLARSASLDSTVRPASVYHGDVPTAAIVPGPVAEPK